MNKTPTQHELPMRLAEFATLAEALDYAAEGETGVNFYDSRGDLRACVTYTELRERALKTAHRLIGLGAKPGDRVALVADTVPEFVDCFFACQYTGLVPVPLPVTVGLGSRDAYVRQLRGLISGCSAHIALAPDPLMPFLVLAAEGLGLNHVGSYEQLGEISANAQLPPAPGPDATAYLQYTSGSTHFPRGVVITQAQVMQNLASITRLGVQTRPDDRLVSWLPLYHDMGLVGFMLGAVASQRSVDYLATRDFAMHPRLWLKLISENRATVAFSPSFAYELCVRRIRPGEADFDLSSWRIAGTGGEIIRRDSLNRFAEALMPSGFDPRAFLACYGMAECALAISFAPLNQGLTVDRINTDVLADEQIASPVSDEIQRASSFVECGRVFPEYEMEIRGADGEILSDRQVGTVFLRGPSVMSGYFKNAEETNRVLSADGWLNTGDLGYRIEDRLVITGRAKDLIIVNGRNIWPQDLEWLAEQQPELRSGDAVAFAAPSGEGQSAAVLLVQCRLREPADREALIKRLHGLMLRDVGVQCLVEAVAPHSLPRTSSGKLSRAAARKDYIAQLQERAEGVAPHRHDTTTARAPQIPRINTQ